MANSKSLGNDYERMIAKKLSKWLTGSDDELVCWRNTHSGSVGTVRKKAGKSGENVSGDFQCLDSTYEKFFNMFYLDSKSLSDVNLFMTNLKNQKSNQLLNEWKKVRDDAQGKKTLMLVKCRKNRSIPEFIVMDLYCVFKCNNFMTYGFNDEKYNCIIVTQDEFFSLNNWEEFCLKNS